VRKTNQQPDSMVNAVPAATRSQDVQPPQFLAVLGDVQDLQAGVAKAQSTSNFVLSELPGTAQGATQTAPSSTSEAKAAPATANPADPGNQPGDAAAPNSAQQTPARTVDALLQTGQAVVSQVGNESKGNAAASSEVAFAARIITKTTDPRAIALDEGHAAIAASRFEGMALRNQAATTPRTAQPATESGVLAQAEQPVAVAASRFDAMAFDSGSGESQSHREPDASGGANSASAQPAALDVNGQAAQTPGWTAQPAAPEAQSPSAAGPAAAPQQAAGRMQSSQANSGAMLIKTAAAGQAGTSALAGPQNASSGMVAAVPASVDASTGRGTANAKLAPQEHGTQYAEAQNEPAERAGEAVRDIALNLSTKDQNVQVRLSERAGELHVTVRTPDATLSHGMREGLSDLVGRLEHGGYRAETWHPAGDSRDRGNDSPSRRGFSQQQNAGGKGSGRQNSQDPESENETPKWIGELESSLQKE
jgi:hypothetical protein